MKTIKRTNHILAALIGFGVLTGALFLIFGEGLSETRARIPLAGSLIVSAAAAGFWLRGQNKLKIALLITENPILRIRTAVISDLYYRTAQQSEIENTQVIISYFGILLGDKIIKFNQDGIRLKAVEIGGDFISLTCGTQKRTQNIRLLRPAIDAAELAKLAESFRYETGIAPIFTAREIEREPPFCKNPRPVC